MQTHHIFFKASLSNGETFYEGKPPFQIIPGQQSPWQRLNNYIVDNRLEITSLSLYTEDGRTFNLPSAGKNPRFHLFKELQKPIDYNYFHSLATEADVIREDNKMVSDPASKKVTDFYAVIEAIYPEYKLQIWVDELNPKNCWTVVTHT